MPPAISNGMQTSPMTCSRTFLRAVIGWMDIEPILMVYMLTSFIKMPVFSALILDKVCHEQYPDEATYCANGTARHQDTAIQTEANQFFLYSTVCLVVPSLCTSFLIGALGDNQSRKLAILVPLVGLVLNYLNYIIQTVYIHNSVYYLLISDVMFGVFGGYAAVISTSLSYAADRVIVGERSYKMAVAEGSIGFGGTIGFLLSGVLLDRFGYVAVFVTLEVLVVLAFGYAMLGIHDLGYSRLDQPLNGPQIGRSSGREDSLERDYPSWMWYSGLVQLIQFFKTIGRRRPGGRRAAILVILGAFMASFIVFSGSSSIMFFYLRHQLNFTSKLYGYYRGLYYGLSTIMVLIAYPLLKLYAHLPDTALAVMGILSRAIGCVLMAFMFADWFVFLVACIFMFNRFAAAGMRSLLSKMVTNAEQGKMFAAIGALEGVANLISSSLFNGAIYPATLNSFAGASYLVMAGFMMISLVAILILHCWLLPSSDLESRQLTESPARSSDDSDLSPIGTLPPETIGAGDQNPADVPGYNSIDDRSIHL